MPSSVKFGYRTVGLVRTEDSASDCHGEYRHSSPEILIHPGQKPMEEANTVLHELVHMFLANAGNPLGERQEEMVAELISNGLTEIFVRNPSVLPWLVQQMGQNRGTRRRV